MTLYELIETAISTHERRADGSLPPVLAKSRRAPMRSAVKRYGLFLGIDVEKAKPDAYHLPEHEIRTLIGTKAPTTLAANTRRNLANDVIALLRIGVEQGWLQPLPPPLLSWKERLKNPHSLTERPFSGRYALPLEQCPPALRDGLMSYLQWCEAPVARNRSRAIAKRPVTSLDTKGMILRLAGFAVRELGQPIESLTLANLCQLEVVEAYANWWLQRRGKMTATLLHDLIMPVTVARHWLKDAELAKALTQLRQSLPPVEAVHQKDKHWLSLQQLEEVGLSLHPLNPRRLQEHPHIRKPSYLRRRDCSRVRVMLYIEFSLIIRLLIRLPMRQRCIREMQLGKNLYQDHAGVWQIRFVGAELKVAHERGAVKRYEFPFPADLVPLLEEWLQDWRPNLAAPDEPHVFVNSRGRPFIQAGIISDMIGRITYRFTGVSVNPHMIRDIFATEYLRKFRGDISGAARRLGNTEAMIIKTYAHILKEDVDERTEAFLRETFANGKGTSR
jgi:integrase